MNLLCPKEVLLSADVHDESTTECVEIPDTSAIVPLSRGGESISTRRGTVGIALFICWLCCPSPSSPEIIAHDQTENEPGGADRASQRAADLRFSDTWVVTHRFCKLLDLMYHNWYTT